MVPELKLATIERFWSNVEKSRGCWTWKLSLSNGYGKFKMGAKTQYAHRVSFSIENGPIPEGMQIDHICHKRSCVKPAHLRLVTIGQNQENRAGASRANASGIRGVRWVESRNAWRARVGHNGKSIHVGYFDTANEAEAAVIAKRNELFTHNDLDRI